MRHIEDQVHSIARMVEQDQYCIDILTRVTASSRALHSVAVGADGADEQSRSK
ncbi:MAG: metal-sensing transcriptional repressor [Actinomycetota bacterium]